MSAFVRRLRALAPYLAEPKLWCWSRRGVAMGMAIGLAITACFSAVASYLPISRIWIRHVAAKRRGYGHDDARCFSAGAAGAFLT